jgi:formate hydrogenlyase subunit 3/multisubunit Na+/H+ antiporter MnhD subunit
LALIRPDTVFLNWLLALPFCAALCAEVFPRLALRVHSEREREALTRGPFALGALASIMGCALAASLLSVTAHGTLTSVDYWWSRDLYHLRFQADALASAVVLSICGLGFLIHLHFLALPEQRQAHHRAALLLAVQGSGMAAALSTDVLALIFFAELMLVGLWRLTAIDEARGSDRLLVTAHGGTLLLLAAAILMWLETGDSSLAEMPWLLLSASASTVGMISLLVLLGLLPRLACVPGHGWAPALAEGGAAIGLAPVVLLTLVGGDILLRMLPGSLPAAVPPVTADLALAVGLAALAWGILRSWVSRGLRHLAAWLAVAQSGYLLIALSLAARPGAPAEAAQAAVLHVVLAPLALLAVWCAASGVMTRVGSDSLAGLSGLLRSLPIEGIALLAGGLSVAGVPPLAGFWVQRSLVLGSLHVGHLGLAATLVVADVLLAGVVVNAFARAFLRREAPPVVRPTSLWMVAQLCAVGAVLVVCGTWGRPLLAWSHNVFLTVLSMTP